MFWHWWRVTRGTAVDHCGWERGNRELLIWCVKHDLQSSPIVQSNIIITIFQSMCVREWVSEASVTPNQTLYLVIERRKSIKSIQYNGSPASSLSYFQLTYFQLSYFQLSHFQLLTSSLSYFQPSYFKPFLLPASPVRFENSFFHWIGPKNDSIQNSIQNKIIQ